MGEKTARSHEVKGPAVLLIGKIDFFAVASLSSAEAELGEVREI